MSGDDILKISLDSITSIEEMFKCPVGSKCLMPCIEYTQTGGCTLSQPTSTVKNLTYFTIQYKHSADNVILPYQR